MICVDLQPINIVENTGFSELIQYLQPGYHMISRRKMSKTLIPAKYNEKREKIINYLRDNLLFGSFTIDCWKSLNEDSFISFTCHLVDKNYKMSNLNLETHPFNDQHNSDNIYKITKSIMDRWNIKARNVVCIVHDNAANMKAAFKTSEYKSVYCPIHTLQLAINDTLALEFVAALIMKIKNIISHFHRSSVSKKLLYLSNVVSVYRTKISH